MHASGFTLAPKLDLMIFPSKVSTVLKNWVRCFMLNFTQYKKKIDRVSDMAAV